MKDIAKKPPVDTRCTSPIETIAVSEAVTTDMWARGLHWEGDSAHRTIGVANQIQVLPAGRAESLIHPQLAATRTGRRINESYRLLKQLGGEGWQVLSPFVNVGGGIAER
jgi:hypothetical protein